MSSATDARMTRSMAGRASRWIDDVTAREHLPGRMPHEFESPFRMKKRVDERFVSTCFATRLFNPPQVSASAATVVCTGVDLMSPQLCIVRAMAKLTAALRAREHIRWTAVFATRTVPAGDAWPSKSGSDRNVRIQRPKRCELDAILRRERPIRGRDIADFRHVERLNLCGLDHPCVQQKIPFRRAAQRIRF